MNHTALMHGLVLLLAVALGGALAQTRPSLTNGGKGIEPAVMSDVGPLPAQERGSLGAIILYDSMVLAQRDFALRARAAMSSADRSAHRAPMKAQREGDLAQRREGAAGLTEK